MNISKEIKKELFEAMQHLCTLINSLACPNLNFLINCLMLDFDTIDDARETVIDLYVSYLLVYFLSS